MSRGGSKPCLPGCTCRQHSCPDGCKCSRHDPPPPGLRSRPCPPKCSCRKHGGRRAQQLREENHMKRPEHRAAASRRALKQQKETPRIVEGGLEPKGATSPLGIRPPSAATLRKYGITAEEWMARLEAQGWRCPICQRAARLLHLNTDHDHVPQWEKMEPEERRKYFRGILCAHCNFRRVNSRMPAAEAQRIADYLRDYEQRRSA